MIGRTDGGRVLTLVIEQTADPRGGTYDPREAMSNDPWTDPDPQPGDFDALLASVDPRLVEEHEGNQGARLRILVSVEGEDAERLERIAGVRGKKPGEIVAELLREADRSAA